jgi:hypothetical protein
MGTYIHTCRSLRSGEAIGELFTCVQAGRRLGTYRSPMHGPAGTHSVAMPNDSWETANPNQHFHRAKKKQKRYGQLSLPGSVVPHLALRTLLSRYLGASHLPLTHPPRPLSRGCSPRVNGRCHVNEKPASIASLRPQGMAWRFRGARARGKRHLPLRREGSNVCCCYCSCSCYCTRGRAPSGWLRVSACRRWRDR